MSLLAAAATTARFACENSDSHMILILHAKAVLTHAKAVCCSKTGFATSIAACLSAAGLPSSAIFNTMRPLPADGMHSLRQGGSEGRRIAGRHDAVALTFSFS